MVKKLFLLRHGQTVSGFNMRDFDRSLTPTGEQDIQHLARVLKNNNFSVDKIYCSPAKRTRQTCALLLEGLELELEPVVNESIYEATLDQLFEVISQTDCSINSVLLVGHNPGISYLCDYLTNAVYTGMSPGQMISIDFEIDCWKEITKGVGTIHV